MAIEVLHRRADHHRILANDLDARHRRPGDRIGGHLAESRHALRGILALHLLHSLVGVHVHLG